MSTSSTLYKHEPLRVSRTMNNIALPNALGRYGRCNAVCAVVH